MNRTGVIVIGFQKIQPEEFIILAEIIGNLSALEMPYNLQNTIGNWLQLLGQVLITFNGQQQYYEQGPGRVFHQSNLNVDNSDCSQNQAASQIDIEVLAQQIQALQSSVEQLKNRLDDLENYPSSSPD